MKTTTLILTLSFLTISKVLLGQNYTSLADGVWTSESNWNRTSNWGTLTPPINGSHSSGTATMQHDLLIETNYILGSATLNVNSEKTLTVSGNMQLNGGSNVNVYGTLYITGNLTLSGNFTVHPGGKVVIDGNVIVNSSNYLRVGTTSAPPPHADMVIGQNLSQQGSGDATIYQNGRLAVFGNVSDNNGGGTFIRVNNGGQVYVHGNVNYSGGGSSIQNNNSTNPYGLYVNGTVTNSGGGASTTPNLGDQNTMITTNPDFLEWIASQENSPLPVTLIYFNANHNSGSGVHVTWATASELNNDYFTIERSRNGKNFEAIARVEGSGTTHTRKDYSYTDQHPFLGLSYYRLRQTDYDGTNEVFPAVRVLLTGQDQLSIYPNPLTGQSFQLKSANNQSNESFVLNVYNIQGKCIFSREIVADVYGNIQSAVDLGFVPEKGTYLVELLSQNNKFMQKIQAGY